MSTPKTTGGSSRWLWAVVPIVVILLPLGYSLAASALAPGPEPGDVFLEMPAEGSGPCVMDPEWMRYRHMDLLKEMRIDAVRYGIREHDGKQITFNICTKCHTSRARFCNRCHEAVNLYPDCFGCHFYPE